MRRGPHGLTDGFGFYGAGSDVAGDPYKELGVARGASQDDIRKAFRKLAKEFHPDKNPGDTAAEDRFKRITAAFDIVGDEEKRRKFDRGEIDADGREQFRGFGGGGEAGDALIELKVQPHPLYRREGADLHMDLPVSVPDAVLGGKVTVKTPDGAVSMTIPKASNSGQVLRLKGKGAFAGGKRGDLLAKLVVTLPEYQDHNLVKFAEKWRADRPYSPGKA